MYKTSTKTQRKIRRKYPPKQECLPHTPSLTLMDGKQVKTYNLMNIAALWNSKSRKTEDCLRKMGYWQ